MSIKITMRNNKSKYVFDAEVFPKHWIIMVFRIYSLSSFAILSNKYFFIDDRGIIFTKTGNTYLLMFIGY